MSTLFRTIERTRFSYSLPLWLKEKLIELSVKKGRDSNDLITDALLKTYPELQPSGTNVLRKILKTG
jgi:hypothetical protein